MVVSETKIRIKDNSGAIKVKCIQTYKNSQRKSLKPLGLLLVSIRKIKMNKNKIEKGKLYKGILIRQNRNYIRLNGDGIKFEDNCIILLNERFLPIASRIKGPLYKEFRVKYWSKVLILSNFSL